MPNGTLYFPFCRFSPPFLFVVIVWFQNLWMFLGLAPADRLQAYVQMKLNVPIHGVCNANSHAGVHMWDQGQKHQKISRLGHSCYRKSGPNLQKQNRTGLFCKYLLIFYSFQLVGIHALRNLEDSMIPQTHLILGQWHESLQIHKIIFIINWSQLASQTVPCILKVTWLH